MFLTSMLLVCRPPGILCVVLGILVLFLDHKWPEMLTTFFGVDIANYYEEFYVGELLTT